MLVVKVVEQVARYEERGTACLPPKCFSAGGKTSLSTEINSRRMLRVKRPAID